MSSPSVNARTISTHLGDIKIKVIGDDEHVNKTLCVMIPGAKTDVADEWIPTAMTLAATKKYTCVIIDFHSNTKTIPGILMGGVKTEDISLIINKSILDDTFQKPKAVIMGKSWGGFQATEHCIKHYTRVLKLCLVAPAFSSAAQVEAFRTKEIPTFLAWCRDDMLMWFSSADLWTKGMDSYIQFYSEDKGGHVIKESFGTPITNFLQDFDVNSVGIITPIKTHLGIVDVRIVGGENVKEKPLVVCFPGGKQHLNAEWLPLASELEKKGFAVCVVNFHSNALTTPRPLIGGIQPDDTSKLINEAVMRDVFQKEEAIILGKSLGGYMATEYTVRNPTKVLKLCVQAPAFSSAPRIAGVKASKVHTLLMWAKDDPLISFSQHKEWVKGMDTAYLTFHQEDVGGHSLTDKYTSPILSFITDTVTGTVMGTVEGTGSANDNMDNTK